MKRERKNEKGQIILIVLLTSAVVATIGLAASKTAIKETAISYYEELAQQAFNAAESGIAVYKSNEQTNYVAPDSKSSADVSTNDLGGGSEISSEGLVLSFNNFLFWLVNHDTNGDIGSSYYAGNSVNICVDDTFDKALKIDYFYKNLASYQVLRKGYNFDNGSTVDGFELKAGKGGCVTLDIIGSPLMIATTPIGGSTKITLKATPGNDFPVQGEEIVSVGRAGDINSKTSVNTQIRELINYKIPSFMLEAITAGGNVMSN